MYAHEKTSEGDFISQFLDICLSLLKQQRYIENKHHNGSIILGGGKATDFNHFFDLCEVKLDRF